MTRTDDDSREHCQRGWLDGGDGRGGAGHETSSDNPLISDPFAAVLVGGGELAELMGKLTAL